MPNGDEKPWELYKKQVADTTATEDVPPWKLYQATAQSQLDQSTTQVEERHLPPPPPQIPFETRAFQPSATRVDSVPYTGIPQPGSRVAKGDDLLTRSIMAPIEALKSGASELRSGLMQLSEVYRKSAEALETPSERRERVISESGATTTPTLEQYQKRKPEEISPGVFEPSPFPEAPSQFPAIIQNLVKTGKTAYQLGFSTAGRRATATTVGGGLATAFSSLPPVWGVEAATPALTDAITPIVGEKNAPKVAPIIAAMKFGFPVVLGMIGSEAGGALGKTVMETFHPQAARLPDIQAKLESGKKLDPEEENILKDFGLGEEIGANLGFFAGLKVSGTVSQLAGRVPFIRKMRNKVAEGKPLTDKETTKVAGLLFERSPFTADIVGNIWEDRSPVEQVRVSQLKLQRDFLENQIATHRTRGGKAEELQDIYTQLVDVNSQLADLNYSDLARPMGISGALPERGTYLSELPPDSWYVSPSTYAYDTFTGGYNPLGENRPSSVDFTKGKVGGRYAPGMEPENLHPVYRRRDVESFLKTELERIFTRLGLNRPATIDIAALRATLDSAAGRSQEYFNDVLKMLFEEAQRRDMSNIFSEALAQAAKEKVNERAGNKPSPEEGTATMAEPLMLGQGAAPTVTPEVSRSLQEKISAKMAEIGRQPQTLDSEDIGSRITDAEARAAFERSKTAKGYTRQVLHEIVEGWIKKRGISPKEGERRAYTNDEIERRLRHIEGGGKPEEFVPTGEEPGKIPTTEEMEAELRNLPQVVNAEGELEPVIARDAEGKPITASDVVRETENDPLVKIMEMIRTQKYTDPDIIKALGVTQDDIVKARRFLGIFGEAQAEAERAERKLPTEDDISDEIKAKIAEGKTSQEDIQAALNLYRVMREQGRGRVEMSEARLKRRQALNEALRLKQSLEEMPESPIVTGLKKLGYKEEDIKGMSDATRAALIEGKVRKNRNAVTEAKRKKWRDIADEVKKRNKETGGIAGGLSTYDPNMSPLGGMATHEKIAYILEPILDKAEDDARAAIASGRIKVGEYEAHAKKIASDLLMKHPDFQYMNPQDKRSVLRQLRTTSFTQTGRSYEDEDYAKRAANAKQMSDFTKAAYASTFGDQAKPVQTASDALNVARTVFERVLDRANVNRTIKQERDAMDTKSNVLAQEIGNRVRLMFAAPKGDKVAATRAKRDLISMPFVLQAGGDKAKLASFITIMGENGNKKSRHGDTYNQIVQYALDNFNTLDAKRQAIESVFHDQATQENIADIATKEIANYVPGLYAQSILDPVLGVLFADTGLEKLGHLGQRIREGLMTETRGVPGGGRSFLKHKVYENYAVAIKNGETPQSLDISQLVEYRVKRGQRLINEGVFFKAMEKLTEPGGSDPIIAPTMVRIKDFSQGGKLIDVPKRSLVYGNEGKVFYQGKIVEAQGQVEPKGDYVLTRIGDWKQLYVKRPYRNLMDAMFANSWMQTNIVGQVAVQSTQFLKHSLLFFDTYHMNRIMMKELFMIGKVGWKRGLTILQYTDADLDKAISLGEITQAHADYARKWRPLANDLMSHGVNVGRIYEGMYSELTREIPFIRTYNRWLFEKMTRGAMLESAMVMFERNQRRYPSMGREELLRRTATEANQYFGNLMHQSVLWKSRGFQDFSRLIFLAPQWTESMLRTEIQSARQIIGAVGSLSPTARDKLAVGNMAQSAAGGIAAMFVANQIINMAFRGHPTWENEENDHKLDAFIPVGGGDRGLFMQPFSIQAELFHDLYRYWRRNGSWIQSGERILGNKLSVPGQTVRTLFSQTDFEGRPLQSDMERLGALAQNVPFPINISAAIRSFTRPELGERQVLSSLGIKVEPKEPTSIEASRILRQRVNEAQLAEWIARKAINEEKPGNSRWKIINDETRSVDDTRERFRIRRAAIKAMRGMKRGRLRAEAQGKISTYPTEEPAAPGEQQP